MIITDISPDKKHCNRITLDDGSQILLDLDLFCEVSLHEGDNIDKERLKLLKERSDFIRAKSRALWLLNRCSYSEKALYDKLCGANFSKKTSAAVIKRLKELRLLDDRAYACRLVEDLTRKNVSKREIFARLLQKGVDKELINLILEENAPDEEQQIKALIQKKYKDKLGDPKENGKVYAALCRKGFSFQAVRNALKEYIEELQFSNGEDY